MTTSSPKKYNTQQKNARVAQASVLLLCIQFVIKILNHEAPKPAGGTAAGGA